jgi:hypothetical protein
MRSGGPNNESVAGELEAAQPSPFVDYRCLRCGTVTKHMRDPAGVLHCRRCVLEESIPPWSAEPIDEVDDVDEVVATPSPKLPAAPRAWSKPIAVAALAIAVLVIAVAAVCHAS